MMTFLIRRIMLLAILCVLSIQVAARQKPGPSSVHVEVRLAEFSKAAGLIKAPVKDSGLTIYLHKTVLISNRDVAAAKVVASDPRIASMIRAAGIKVGPDKEYEVKITFTNEAAPRIEKATEKHLNKPIAIIIDGVVMSTPFLTDKLSDGARISGLTQEEAEKIASSLNQK